MAAKIVKKEVMSDEIKEFGEDAATAINELLGLYGYEDEHKRNELSVKFQRNSCKKIANISQKLMESKRQSRGNDSSSESLRMVKMNDYSSISSDKDSSSREEEDEDSKSPMILKSMEKAQENNCSWCHQNISQQSNEIIGSGGAVFCSENCFLFWRRASFKRAKTCDFCKNIRNAVSYVDFNDGTTQLQFCSDKCLNQYKMQIFCRETQAQLELNPHLKDNKSESTEHLITPELWLKNCRTRSPTPEQEQHEHQRLLSKSPSSPSTGTVTSITSNVLDDKVMKSIPQSSTKITSTVTNLTHSSNDGLKKKQPLINVLPSSKLLSRNILHHKNLRKRRVSSRLAMNTSTATISATNGTTTTLVGKLNQNANVGIANSERIMNTNFPADLRAKIHAQMNNGSKSIQSTTPGSHFNRNAPPPPPTSLSSSSSSIQQGQQVLQQFMHRPPPINLFKFRMPFPISPQQRMPMLPLLPPPQPPHDDPSMNPLHAASNPLLPPPVVLVPYPIPLPIVIPIPLPLTAFMRAYQTKRSSELSPTNENDNDTHEKPPAQAKKEDDNRRVHENEQPLDLSSEQQGVCCDIDKDFLTQQFYHNNNNNNDDVVMGEDDDDDDDESFENVSSSYQSIPKFEISRVNNPEKKHHQKVHPLKEDSSCESNRPLRKRKIAMEEVSECQ